METPESLVPVGLDWRTSRWRRYGLFFDPSDRTATWTDRSGSHQFALPGSTARTHLPVLTTLTVITYRNGSFGGKMFVLLDQNGALLGRTPKSFRDVFDRTWPTAGLQLVRSWGVTMDSYVGSLIDVDTKYRGAAPEALYVRPQVIRVAAIILILVATSVVLAAGQLTGH